MDQIGMWEDPRETPTSWKSPSNGKGWHPDLPGIDWNNILNQVLLEIYKWQEQESFSFLIPWANGQSRLLNVPSAVAVLEILSKFLRRATKSEDEAIQEILTGFVQSDAAARNYIWWLLSGGQTETMDSVVLGRELAALVKAYALGRRILHEKVDEHINVMRMWGASYGERQIMEVLDEVYRQLHATRIKFQFYKEALTTARLRRTNYKNGGMYPKALIREKLQELHLAIFPRQDVAMAEKSEISQILASPNIPVPKGSSSPGTSFNAAPGSPVSRSSSRSSYSSSPVLNSLCSWHSRPSHSTSLNSEGNSWSSMNSPLSLLPQGTPFESNDTPRTSVSSFTETWDSVFSDSPVMKKDAVPVVDSNGKSESPCFTEDFGESTFQLFPHDDEPDWDAKILLKNIVSLSLLQLIGDSE